MALDRASARATEAAIATRYLSELWPDAAHLRVATSMDIGHWWELPYGERAVVDAIVRLVRPEVSFEFGTFTGSTTALIAAASPRSSVVHTIDVPEHMIDETYRQLGVTPDLIGSRLDEDDAGGGSITFHRQLIEDFDIVADDGVVVWDDYQVGPHPGVTRALSELADEVSLAHIATTRLVVHGRGRFAFATPP